MARSGRQLTLIVIAVLVLAVYGFKFGVQQPAEQTIVHAGGDVTVVKLSGFSRRLMVPVRGVPISSIQDTFADARGDRIHEATDILAPKGTPVVAADDGTVKKLYLSKQGGITLYQFDSEDEYCYYYAHLDGYAEGIHEGMKLEQGDVIGYVGTTGNALAGTPHLHFGIFLLGPQKRWWQGTPVNPYPLLMRADTARQR